MTTGSQLITDFESSINAVRAVSGFLKGGGHPAMGTGPSSPALAKLATLPAQGPRKKAFQIAGRSEALPQKKISEIDVDAIDEWVVDEYRDNDDGDSPTQYPAVVIGAVSGAAFFLSTALGVPYLPQTTLVSVKDGETLPDMARTAVRTAARVPNVRGRPDDITGAIEHWAPTGRQIAENNPRVAVYHMHDPAQDRPMMQQAAFFRLKRKTLGPVYEEFLRDHLAEGGTVITLENTRTWRSTHTGAGASQGRSFFQFGCLGGLPEQEYVTGSQRVREFLAAEGSEYQQWTAPESTGRTRDGEWGFDSALGEDIESLADRQGWRRRRLVQNEPQDASAFVAELYRDWYARMGWTDNRLLVQTYNHLDPWWTLATGSVPFWNRFHMRPSYEVLRDYLKNAEPYDQVLVSLFSHGLVSPGLVSVEEWEQLATWYARGRGEVIGVDREAYPVDTGAAFRYQEAMKTVGEHRELPESLSLEEVDAFAEKYGILTDGLGLAEHTDDVAGEGLRNPVAWVAD